MEDSESLNARLVVNSENGYPAAINEPRFIYCPLSDDLDFSKLLIAKNKTKISFKKTAESAVPLVDAKENADEQEDDENQNLEGDENEEKKDKEEKEDLDETPWITKLKEIDKIEKPDKPDKLYDNLVEKAKKVYLKEVYHDIFLKNIFKKEFTLDGSADLVAFRKGSPAVGEKPEIEQKIALYQKEMKSIHLISSGSDISKRSCTYLKISPGFNLDLEFMEFTPDGNFLLLGNRGFVLLWNVNNNSIEDKFLVRFETTQPEIENFNQVKIIKNYNFYVTEDKKMFIVYSLGNHVFRIKLGFNKDSKLEHEILKFTFDNEVYSLYMNTEIAIQTQSVFSYVKNKMVVITFRYDSFNEESKIMKSIVVLDLENMKMIGNSGMNREFEDIYFKLSNEGIITMIKNYKLYSITIKFPKLSNDDGLKRQDPLNLVEFGNEIPINPDFFFKNEVMKVENSSYSSLVVEYSPKFAQDPHYVLMDYKLENEIKKLGKNVALGAKKIYGRFFFHINEKTLTVFSLSKLKSDPYLETKQNIIDVKASLPFIFIEIGDIKGEKNEDGEGIKADKNKVPEYINKKIVCYQIILTPQGTISTELTTERIKEIDKNFSKTEKHHLIEALCQTKDSSNLKVYLNYRGENLDNNNFENIPLGDCIQHKSFACIDLLLKYIINIEKGEDKIPKLRILYDEIETNLGQILICGSPQVPELLNKLYVTITEYGTPRSEFLPIYHSYELASS